MPRFRVQFTIFALAVAVALVGLNLAGAIATWRYYARSPAHAGSPGVRVGSGLEWPIATGPDGAVHMPVASLKTGECLEQVVWLVPAPSFLQKMSPVIASLSITLLALALPWSSAGSRNHFVPTGAGGRAESPLLSRRGATRWVIIGVSLFGLNLAGAVFRPLPDSAIEASDQSRIPPMAHDVLVRQEGGRFVIHWSNCRETRPEPGDVDGHIVETVIFKPNGAVVAYEGSPGLLRRLLTWPRVVREPTRSLLEMWWPALAAAAITFLVLRSLWLQARRGRDDSTFWFGTE